MRESLHESGRVASEDEGVTFNSVRSHRDADMMSTSCLSMTSCSFSRSGESSP